MKINWSPQFAYAIGLITTDGNLSKDGRHMNMTSKDIDLIMVFKKCLGLSNTIGRKSRGKSKEKKYFQVQFGDINFYNFLVSIGLSPAKSKTLSPLNIPDDYFSDFLRGCIDGDGSIGVFRHPESEHGQLRVRLCSASRNFLQWVKDKISSIYSIEGGWVETKNSISVLVYAKADSIKLLNFVYYPEVDYYLKRKYERARPFLRV